jgi:N-formylglutamate amidohydrolase
MNDTWQTLTSIELSENGYMDEFILYVLEYFHNKKKTLRKISKQYVFYMH